MDTAVAGDPRRYKGGYPAGNLRVSDADRDRAIGELSEHFQAGRLNDDEFEERSGQALHAVTGADLVKLFDDLPRNQTLPVQAGTPGPHPVSRLPAGPIAIALPLIVLGIVALGSGHHHGHHGATVVLPALIVAFVVGCVMRVARVYGHSQR
jgi:hypothetical protein